MRPPPVDSPSVGGSDSRAASDSGNSDTSSVRRRWKAVIAALPPVLPSQQQVLQQLMQDSWGGPQQLIIDPDARSSRLWNALVLLVLLGNAATVPFRVAFAPVPDAIDALWTFGIACDVLLMLDIVVMLNRGYHEQGHKEMERRTIRRRFACALVATSHTTLAVCVLALVPLDLLELANPQAFYLRGALRSNRLLLTPRAFTLLRELCEPHLGRQRVMFLRLVLLFALIVHAISCLWCAPPRAFVRAHSYASLAA